LLILAAAGTDEPFAAEVLIKPGRIADVWQWFGSCFLELGGVFIRAPTLDHEIPSWSRAI
jgi:hypothetical protein